MIGVMAVVGGSDLITGFKSALAFMGGLSIVSGILVAILMPKDAAYGVSDEEKENQKKITFKDYVSAFKIPGVWIMAILVWCYVTISAVASYLTPYSTGVLGMSATLAATIGTFRTYGCRLIGGPLGSSPVPGMDTMRETWRNMTLWRPRSAAIWPIRRSSLSPRSSCSASLPAW